MDAPILFCQGLSKSFGTTFAIQELSLSIRAGETVGLFGPRDSGKTTLVKLIAGLLVPLSGSIEIGGVSPSACTRGMISYLPDRNALPPAMNIQKLVDFYGRMFSDFDAEKANDLFKELRVNTAKPMKKLSSSTRKRVALILTMCRRARLYLLDEPIGDASPAAKDYILKTVFSARAENSAILVATHAISDMEPYLDSFLLLSSGSVAAQGNVAAYTRECGMTLDQAARRIASC